MRYDQSNSLITPLSEVNRQSLRHSVLHHIRQAIINGELKGGQQLNELEIARRIGVSRGLVREVMRELESSGIIVSIAYRGAFVRDWTAKDVHEVYTLRAQLEDFAISLSVPRLTDKDIQDLEEILNWIKQAARENDTIALVEYDMDFHLRLASVSGHNLLLKMLRDLSGQTRMIITALAISPDLVAFPQNQVETHEQILSVIKQRDTNLLRQVIKDHICEYGEQLFHHLENLEQTQRDGHEARFND